MVRPAFDIVHDPSGAEVDIIAAHGLGANVDWTWIWKDPKVRSIQVRWLSDHDMLPAVIPRARVVLYNYDSRWHSHAPRVTLRICGDRFIQTLHDFRRSLPNRPIVFIGHSLGSIVIQQGLLIADSRDDLRYLTHVTAGLVTLGSPLRGIKKNVQPSFLIKLLQFRGSWGGIIEELTYENDTLLEKLERFIRLAKAREFDVFCFFELYETKFGKKFFFGGKFGAPLRAMIVPETSACISGFDRCGLQADHFKINKFSGPNDASFTRVASQLLQMCNAATSIPSKKQPLNRGTEDSQRTKPLAETENPAEIDQCLRYLFLSSPTDDLCAMKRMRGERAEGTCEWIMEAAEMKTWLLQEHSQPGTPASNLLWLQGNPGVGKSTMAAFIVEHLSKVTTSDERAQVTFFFCSSTFDTRNTATAILRGLLWQLLSSQRQLVSRYVLPSYRAQGPNIFVSFDALWSIFLSVMCDENLGTQYIIIDGLDECKEESRFALLKQIKGKFGPKGPFRTSARCRLLILSRPSPDLQRAFRGLRAINLSTCPEIEQDIARFIEEKVTDLRVSIPYPPAVAENVTQILERKAEGTFLWAGIACAELEKCDAKDAIRCLETLPSTLNDMYKDILESACGHAGINKEKIRRLLSFTITALYPLSLLELSAACNLHTEHSGQIRAAFMLEEIESCRRLLVIDNGQVHVLHESVKDFLRGEASGNFIDEEHAHAEFAKRCIELVYWSPIDIETSPSRTLVWSGSFEWSKFDPRCGQARPRALRKVPEKDVLLGYAIFRWPAHARLASHKFVVSGLTSLFFDTRSVLWKGWASVFLPYIMNSSTDSGHSVGYGGSTWLKWTALDVAALTDTPTLANFAIQQQGVSVEGRHLMYAAVEKHWDIFRNLVNNLSRATPVSAESIEDFIILQGWLPQAHDVLRTLFGGHPKIQLRVTPSLLLTATWKGMEVFQLLFNLRQDGLVFDESSVLRWMEPRAAGKNHPKASKVLAEARVPGFTESDLLMERLASMGCDLWPGEDILDVMKILCDSRDKDRPITQTTWIKAAGNTALGHRLVRLLVRRGFPGCVADMELVLKEVACNLDRGVEILQTLSEEVPTSLSAAISNAVLCVALSQGSMEHVHRLQKFSLLDKKELQEEDMLVAAASNIQRDLSPFLSDTQIPSSNITEKVLVAAAKNKKHGKVLFEVLLNVHKDVVPLSEAVVVQAAQSDDGLFDLLLDRQAFDKSMITPSLYHKIEQSGRHERSGNLSRNLIRRRDPALAVPDMVIVARYLSYEDAENLLDWQGDHIITKAILEPVFEDVWSLGHKRDILPLIHQEKPNMPMISVETLDLARGIFPEVDNAPGAPSQIVINHVREVRGGKLLEEEEEAIREWKSNQSFAENARMLREQFLEARKKYVNYDTTGGKEPGRTNCYPGSTGGVTPRRDRRATVCIPFVLAKVSDEVEGRKRRISICSGPGNMTAKDGGKVLPLGC